MATSPAVLNGYAELSAALGAGCLSRRVREQIALVVAQANDSVFCLSVHAAAARAAGLSEVEVAESRGAASADARVDAALKFAEVMVARRGHVSRGHLDRLTAAGWSEAEIAEIIANVGLNVLVNYFNNVERQHVALPLLHPALPEPEPMWVAGDAWVPGAA